MMVLRSHMKKSKRMCCRSVVEGIMKRIFIVLCALAMILSLIGCAATSEEDSPTSNESETIVDSSAQNKEEKLTDYEALSIFKDYLTSWSGSKAVEDELMRKAPSGTESIKNLRVETIEDDRGMHDFDYRFYGSFTAYDKYGKIVDFCTFDMDGWVDNDGRAGVYYGANVKR